MKLAVCLISTIYGLDVSKNIKQGGSLTLSSVFGEQFSSQANNLINHGCWCSRLSIGSSIEAGGIPVDAIDSICRDWFKARRCLSERETNLYCEIGMSYNLENKECQDADPCLKQACMVDLFYSELLLAEISALENFNANTEGLCSSQETGATCQIDSLLDSILTVEDDENSPCDAAFESFTGGYESYWSTKKINPLWRYEIVQNPSDKCIGYLRMYFMMRKRLTETTLIEVRMDTSDQIPKLMFNMESVTTNPAATSDLVNIFDILNQILDSFASGFVKDGNSLSIVDEDGWTNAKRWRAMPAEPQPEPSFPRQDTVLTYYTLENGDQVDVTNWV